MGIPIKMGMGIVVIPWELPYGNPIGITIWESYGHFHGNSHRNPVGMRWEWELKFLSHGNPGSLEDQILFRSSRLRNPESNGGPSD